MYPLVIGPSLHPNLILLNIFVTVKGKDVDVTVYFVGLVQLLVMNDVLFLVLSERKVYITQLVG